MNNRNESVLLEGKKDEKIPFQRQSFIDFVALLGRLFYDDPSIVLLDFLAQEQRAFSEVDLREKLGWRESLIQQKLYLLEKHMLVVQEQLISRGSRTNVYWRINQNIYAATQYRYQQLLERLSRLVDDTSKHHEFECSDVNCQERYTALDAACCSRSLNDEHPLCNRCGSLLKSSESETTRTQAKEKCSRALQQLAPLRQYLACIEKMEVPVFDAYTKTEKKSEEKTAQLDTNNHVLNNKESLTTPPAKKFIAATLGKPQDKRSSLCLEKPMTTTVITPAQWFNNEGTGTTASSYQTTLNHKQSLTQKISFGLKKSSNKSQQQNVSSEQQKPKSYQTIATLKKLSAIANASSSNSTNK